MKKVETQAELVNLSELNSEWSIYESYLENTGNYKPPSKLISFKTLSDALEIFANLPHL